MTFNLGHPSIAAMCRMYTRMIEAKEQLFVSKIVNRNRDCDVLFDLSELFMGGVP